MTTIDKAYDPSQIENQCYKDWEENGYFKASGSGDPYCIMLPPPNVTGSLHMGHGFGFTLIDILIRYQRMQGKNTLWQGGTDHAGIATQMVVERKLLAENISRHDIGREKFVEKIWEWKEESGGNISRQLKRLGASIDWDLERFTMDDHLSQAVRKVFIDLFEEGLIYRGTRLVNWDPVLLTAISDLEVINDEVEGSLWHIQYPIKDTKESITIATTRPETLLGDVAVAVHPDDKRYQHLIGKQVLLPLTDRTIPVIADDYVDPEFGTGCLKITPAHDFNDYDVGKRHKLEPINILTPTASINENAPEAYQGMDRFDARKQILADLEAAGLLIKTEKHQLKVPRGDRSNSVIEPYLTKQWYVKSSEIAQPAIDAVKSGEVRFIPENWNKTYFQWMNNLEDWCISRQLWWGHRIPIWYDDEGNIYAGQDEAEVRSKYSLSKELNLQQDEDVLDTWFSSALWPFSSLGWPEKTPDFKQFFPTSTLITGFDIIFFWVARMMMMSYKFTGKAPFKDIYITGLIRDAEGHKMSKSKGNVLDPIDLIDGIELEDLVTKRKYGMMQPEKARKIEKSTRKEFPEGIPSYGTDALRFTFCAVAGFTRDIRFDTNRLAGYRNFCNKLWNASRYVMMNTEGKDCGTTNKEMQLSLPDRWIISKLHQTLAQTEKHLNDYRFDLAAHTLYEFTWNEFCDWYLELSKPILYSDTASESELRGTRHTLVNVLETLLRTLHPIIPFITESLWQRVAPLAGIDGKTIMQQSYPSANQEHIDQDALNALEWIKKIIISIRTIRSEMNISPAKQIPILLRKGSNEDKEYIQQHETFLSTLAKIEKLEWLADNDSIPPAASAFVDELEIYLPMAGFINPEEESARLNKTISKLDKEHMALDKKLANPGFTSNAPAEVVQKEKEKLAGIKSELDKLKEQLEKIKALS